MKSPARRGRMDPRAIFMKREEEKCLRIDAEPADAARLNEEEE